ncbi:MAG: tyrosine-type recombinase/integrase [Leptothrix sp. (in: b-proteobacteria)]
MKADQSRVRLTVGRVTAFFCPADKSQAFLWDTETPSLALRATPTGRKVYVFEARLSRSTIRVPIGTAADWPIDKARGRAQELKMLVDSGVDPREQERQQAAQKVAAAAAQVAQALTVGSVWPLYLANGRPKRKDAWKPRYLADLMAMGVPGGEKKKRGQGVTRPGPLWPLMALPLSEVNEDTLKAWYDREALTGKHQAARALMMFRGFLRWCTSQKAYRDLTDRDAGKAAAIVENLPSNTKRTDALESAQVVGWWRAVGELSNPTASAYLRALLLTGARREEMAGLRWEDVDFRWQKLTIADKVDKTRTIPLTPYLAAMLAGMTRGKGADGEPSPFVFASASKTGRIADVRAAHERALKSAGIDHLTTHGLRRTFSLLGEAAGAPAGAIAQVMGHKPSATAEGYRPRSVDALRPFLAQIEAHVLALAGVEFTPADADAPGLRVVAG